MEPKRENLVLPMPCGGTKGSLGLSDRQEGNLPVTFCEVQHGDEPGSPQFSGDSVTMGLDQRLLDYSIMPSWSMQATSASIA